MTSGPRARRIGWSLLGAAAVIVGSSFAFRRPSNARGWAIDQALMPEIAFGDSTVRVANHRAFRYFGADSTVVRYDTLTFDLREVETAWLIVARFSEKWRAPAHAFASFGFRDSTFLAISVEARRERDEEYGLLRGLGRNFELMYVIGDERDLIGRRVAREPFDVYLYPIKTNPENARRVLVELLSRAERLRERPEFYNTIWNNCTSNLAAAVNRVIPGRLRGGLELLAAGYADEVAQSLGLLASSETIEDARRRYRINSRAAAALSASDFSIRIRDSVLIE